MPDSYNSIGYITRVHGFKGNVICKITYGSPERLNGIEAVFVKIGAGFVPFFAEKFSIQKKDQALVKFDDIHTEKDARELIGTEIFLPADSLPAEPDSPKSFTGYVLVDSNTGKELGTIEDVEDIPGNPLAVLAGDDAEVYIPIHSELIHRIDKTKKILSVNVPAGLTDLY